MPLHPQLTLSQLVTVIRRSTERLFFFRLQSESFAGLHKKANPQVGFSRLRPASQSRIPVEHRQVRIRDSEEGTPARGWAYFTYPARLTPLDTPRKVYTNPLAKSCISCEKGWIYRKNRYNDPEAGLCSGKVSSSTATHLHRMQPG